MDYIYLILGLLIILLSLMFSKRLGNHPVILKIEKIGFNLNADRLTLFYLFGFLIIGVGVFFTFKGYETRLTDLEQDLKNRDTDLSNLETDLSNLETVKEQLSILKEYEFDIMLEFDSTFDISPRDKSLRYFIDKSKGGKIIQNPITPIFGDVGGAWVHIEHIKPGDKLKILAKKTDTEIWVSEEIEVPKSKIRLTKLDN